MEDSNTKIQIRGICSVCGKFHATKEGLIVPHGYTLDFGFRNAQCNGSDEVHYGDANAPIFLHNLLLEVGSYKAKSPNETHRLNVFKKYLQSRIEDWALSDLVEVNVKKEEQAQRKIREEQAYAKKVEREEKALIKETKRIEREEKMAKKWQVICATNLHQIELDGHVIVEWESSYISRATLENDHYGRLRSYFDGIDNLDDQVRMSMALRTINRVRHLSGKQLIKF